MLLTITNTQAPATDLGYLLHKNPAKAQTFSLAYGQAHVFYPEATEGRCTAALLLDVDPVALVRNRRGPAGEGRALEQYVNDRPYVASSFLSVAIAQVFSSALGGRSKERAELIDRPLPLTARIAALPCRGGESFLRKLFEPLGYQIAAEPHELDEHFPEWGQSRYFTVTLTHTIPLHLLLTHLYVLIPVLDDDKHYWVDEAEVEKLLRHGDGWLADHPEKEQIVNRYLKRQRKLARYAMERLLEEDQSDAIPTDDSAGPKEEADDQITLNQQRLGAVFAALKASGAKHVLDLGCGEGRLLRLLLEDRQFERIVGMDVSYRALEIAKEKLHFDHLPSMQQQRLSLIHGSLNYRDKRLDGFDAAAVVEVIEHLDAPRLTAFERVLFEFAKPRVVVLTTPNSEYNVKWETLPAGHFRHRDHRFEWTRAQFHDWATHIAQQHAYSVEFLPIGQSDAHLGAPTQMAVFTRSVVVTTDAP